MAVNGISSMNQNSNTYESRAQFNFNKFNSNVSLDNMDVINTHTQKAVSETLRARLRDAKRNDDDGINYKLYVKEDENNSNEKRTKSPTHHILNPGESMMKAPGRTSSPAECQTCATRKYQDGSDETDVSFQTPTHIPNAIAASVILNHEHEHVANAYEKEHQTSVNHAHTHAHVDQASVHLKTDICPECGRVYFSGGVTNTVISYIDDEQYDKGEYKPKILIPNGYKDNVFDSKYLQTFLKATDAEIEYFDDPNYKEEEPYIIVPLSLKDKLSREDWLEFLEDITNLKIKPYESPADEYEENRDTKPYMFDDKDKYIGTNINIAY